VAHRSDQNRTGTVACGLQITTGRQLRQPAEEHRASTTQCLIDKFSIDNRQCIALVHVTLILEPVTVRRVYVGGGSDEDRHIQEIAHDRMQVREEVIFWTR
jgi:hypothetical protein